MQGMESKVMAKAKPPTAKQRKLWDRIVSLGCILQLGSCWGRITIHHCGTGGGGRKDHDKVIPLCWAHHLGPLGIDGKAMSKRAWQERYGTETILLETTQSLLRSEDHE